MGRLYVRLARLNAEPTKRRRIPSTGDPVGDRIMKSVPRAQVNAQDWVVLNTATIGRQRVRDWLKTAGGLRKLRHRGGEPVDWVVTFAAAAYNLACLRIFIHSGELPIARPSPETYALYVECVTANTHSLCVHPLSREVLSWTQSSDAAATLPIH